MNKRILHYSLVSVGLLLSPSTYAQDCTITSQTQTQTQGVIESVQDLKMVSSPHIDKFRKCDASFQVKVDGRWHDAIGSYIYAPEMSEKDACEKAINEGKKSVLRQVSTEVLISNETMKCSDKKPDTVVKSGFGGTDSQGRRYVVIDSFGKLPWKNEQ